MIDRPAAAFTAGATCLLCALLVDAEGPPVAASAAFVDQVPAEPAALLDWACSHWSDDGWARLAAATIEQLWQNHAR